MRLPAEVKGNWPRVTRPSEYYGTLVAMLFGLAPMAMLLGAATGQVGM